MKRMVLVEYIGNSDINKKPIGHSTKVLKEYKELLTPDYDVKFAIPYNVVDEIGKSDVTITFKAITILQTCSKTKREQLREKIERFKNLKKVYEDSKDEDVLWFCNVDINLFYYLFVKSKYCKKTICTLYQNNFLKKGLTGKIRNRIFQKVIKRLALVIYTNQNFNFDSDNTFYMPDYYYDERFDLLPTDKKKEQVVCLGTMNDDKKLNEVVREFNKLDRDLYIIGRFYNQDWRKALEKNACKNIHIVDDYIDYQKYLLLLAESKYAILPYDPIVYAQRTSGVLQESIFTKTVPIAPRSFLEYNGCWGIGFENYEQLAEVVTQEFDYNQYVDWCNEQIMYKYNAKVISKELKRVLDNIF